MQPEEHRIKLGAADPGPGTQPPEVESPTIRLGKVQEPKPVEKSQTSQQTSGNFENRESGWSSEASRRQSMVIRLDQAKENEKQVRPWILIMFCSVLLIGAIALVLMPRGSSSLGFNNTTILKQYDDYRARKPEAQLPSKQVVNNQLNSTTILENSGRKEMAKRSWEQLILETQADKQNPIYQLAVKHLKSLK